MASTVATFLDVAEGLQANQFSVGSRDKVEPLSDFDPIQKRLMDEPIPVRLDAGAVCGLRLSAAPSAG
jgi:hypothetical protein